MQARRRVLITGAGGFVGRYLHPALQAALPDAAFTLTRRHDDGARGPEWATIDLADREAADALLAAVRPDLVFHLAAQSSVGTAAAAAAATWIANAGSALALAAAIARHAPQATVFNVSSAEVYGRAFLEGVATERTVPRPANAYARSKLAAEWAFADMLPPTARLVTLRPFNHTGPGQDDRFVVPAFASQIARIERGEQPPVVQVGDLSAQRDFLDVRDVAAAYAALAGQAAGLERGAVFNVASGRLRSIADILALLTGLSRARIEIRQDPARLRPSEIACAAGDGTALRRAVGWRPAIALEKTLEDVLDDFRA